MRTLGDSCYGVGWLPSACNPGHNGGGELGLIRCLHCLPMQRLFRIVRKVIFIFLLFKKLSVWALSVKMSEGRFYLSSFHS